MKLLKLGVSLAILILVGMLYYSNLLLEQEVKAIRTEMRALELRSTAAAPRSGARPHIDPSLPNLLHESDFYTQRLPRLLGPDFAPAGELRTSDMGKPATWHPLSNFAPVSRAWERCVPQLASLDPGHYERYIPELAIKVEERSGEYWIHLREGVFWQPLEQRHFPSGPTLAAQFLERQPVTARDFKFYLDAVMNPYVAEGGALAVRQYLREIEELRVIDDLTFVVRWRVDPNVGRPRYTALNKTMALKPLPCWLYQRFADGSAIIDSDDFRTNSVWAQNFAQHWAVNVIASCGPWVFDGLVGGELRFRRNRDHYNPLAALYEREVVTYRESPDSLWQDFKAGQCDLVESRYVKDKLADLSDFMESRLYATQRPIQRCDYLERAYNYVGWNNQRPPFNSAKVRRAMTLAIDRRRIIEGILGGQGIETTGPFFPCDSCYDGSIEPLPYDPAGARRLLEEEGWIDRDGDGIRDRDGQRFSFRLLYYVKSTQTRLIVDSISTALREIGVECRPVGLDVADFSAAFEGQDFDAITLAWILGTPPDEPRQIWHSDGAHAKGSSNHIGFANADADTIIEALDYEADPDERRRLYHQFHRILHDEQPYTFLYVPKSVLLYRDYVQNVFVPQERPDLIPNANAVEPIPSLFWIKQD